MIPLDPKKLPTHVAIIMDGNGRWAKKRHMSRIRGHQKGTESVRAVVRTSREIGIPWLTLYAFSEENWQRPQSEILALMKLLRQFLKSELNEMLENGIRFQAIGRIHRLSEDLRKSLEHVAEQTADNRDMVLTLALSYGGRQEITDAVQKIASEIEKGRITADEIFEETITNMLYTREMPDPDFLIRTSGECRVSNFLLWQIAYTEIFVTSTLWPDFGKDEYLAAIREFQKRERRFGRA